MGDMKDVFNDMQKAKKERHKEWRSANVARIQESGLAWRWASRQQVCILFREPGKPKVDFYPYTGRWRSDGKTYRGGAASFLSWYAKQDKEAEG